MVLSTIESDIPYCGRWQKLSTDDYLNISHRYAQVATNVCDIYDLPDLGLFMRHIKVESRFQWWRISSKDAVGPMQIREKYHAGKLYIIQDGELGKHLKQRHRLGKTIDHARYLRRIGYNLHVGGALHRQWLNDFGDYAVVLSAYIAGPEKPYTKKLISHPKVLYNTNNQLYNNIRYILGIDL